MIKEAIGRLVEGKDLQQDVAYQSVKEIMEGVATPSQIAGFLVALRNKGETPNEIAGCALAMRDAARPLALNTDRILDTCGTGGDQKHGLNVSTAVALVVAGAGWTVAKHGNRAVSSRSGSADVLEALGVKIDPPPAVVEKCLNEGGIGFLFAPSFHPAMKHAMPTRRELGIRTVFNILGPLTNPARARVQLIGVYAPTLCRTVAEVMGRMGHLGGLVVHAGGWDEIVLDTPVQVAELHRGRVKMLKWTHKSFGLPKVASRHLKGGDAAQNAQTTRDVLEGRDLPARHVVVANAAALLWCAERAFDRTSADLTSAVRAAEASLDSGAARKKLEQLIDLSHTLE